MNANIKKHDNYRCDKTLKSLDLKKKHIPLSHENVKLYFHFLTMNFLDAYIAKLSQAQAQASAGWLS
jgi:hypothetical protein